MSNPVWIRLSVQIVALIFECDLKMQSIKGVGYVTKVKNASRIILWPLDWGSVVLSQQPLGGLSHISLSLTKVVC